ncbi:hypothetical protein RNAN_0325 [Rheinheimera nanhaiensis E407-8]|uniref:Uncharacterized protein n=1 Tax=Rheinheimera nanhaiensis E407-8 TaxID=562729 RepID=I1DTI4_9GAMM|nr:hypothetical protein RNAN_0325 [Rheinheimera nanhaiensis E407-8]
MYVTNNENKDSYHSHVIHRLLPKRRKHSRRAGYSASATAG